MIQNKPMMIYLSLKVYEMAAVGGSGEEELQEVLSGSWQSSTALAKPMTHDKIYYFLPYWDDKPCLHVRSVWPDYRRRMYTSNMLSKIVDKFVSYSILHLLHQHLINFMLYAGRRSCRSPNPWRRPEET